VKIADLFEEATGKRSLRAREPLRNIFGASHGLGNFLGGFALYRGREDAEFVVGAGMLGNGVMNGSPWSRVAVQPTILRMLVLEWMMLLWCWQ
jgi:hypothetical protein